ncbi:MAG: CPBP family glutamic-type intramembrane protease [Anaerotignaceae bacterium]
MLRLTKKAKTFVIYTFIISYISFIYLAFNVKEFSEILQNPLNFIILSIGCTAPFLVGVGFLIKEKTLKKELLTIAFPKNIYLVFFFIVLHYGLATVLHLVGSFGDVINFILAIPIIIILVGLGEIGWRKILFEELSKDMGIWRANICVGLFMSLCFVPLLYIPQFLLTPDTFIPFSFYMVGMGILSTTIYKHSGSIIYSVLFVGLFISFSTIFQLKMGNSLIIMFVVDLVIGIAYNSDKLNKNNVIKTN